MDRSLTLANAGSEAMTKPKPGLLIVAQLPPPVHGASVVNQMVVNSAELRKRFALHVVPIDATQELADIRKFSIIKVARSFRTLVRVCHKIWRERPQLGYLTLSPKGFAFYRDTMFVAAFRLARLPHVLHLHGRGMRKAHEDRWSAALLRWTLRRATVIHLSPLLEQDVTPFVDRSRLRFVANGVADPLPHGAYNHLSKKQQGVPVILFLATMLESKGPLVLVEALALLKQQNVEFKAIFAGPWRGSLSEKDFASRIEAAGLTHKVRHLGAIYGDAKSELLQSADIMAFPTHYEHEAFPLVVLEGMGAGLVPVTSDIAALPDMVNGVGYCVPPQAPEALAKVLKDLLSNRQLLRAMQAKARAKYESSFTLQRFEQALAKVLEEVATGDKAPAADMTAETRKTSSAW